MPKDCLALVFHRTGVWSPSNKKRTQARRWYRWWRRERRERAVPVGHHDKALVPSGGSSSLKVQNFR